MDSAGMTASGRVAGPFSVPNAPRGGIPQLRDSGVGRPDR
jgi:hypothetical protein